jgi:hypothetical protein
VNAKLREKIIDEILKNDDYLEDNTRKNKAKTFEKMSLLFLIIIVGLLLLTLF